MHKSALKLIVTAMHLSARASIGKTYGYEVCVQIWTQILLLGNSRRTLLLPATPLAQQDQCLPSSSLQRTLVPQPCLALQQSISLVETHEMLCQNLVQMCENQVVADLLKKFQSR